MEFTVQLPSVEDEFAEFQQELDRTPYHTVKHTFCPAGVLPMWVADLDLPIDPLIHACIKQRAEHPTFGYTIQPPALWSAVSDWLLSQHGWKVDIEHFVFTGNLVSATVNALQAFTEPGETVALIRPLYTPLQQLVTGSGRRLVAVDASPGSDTSLVLDLALLRSTLVAEGARALIWCSPHNPSGRVWTEEEVCAVAGLCKELGVFIISDEIHSDLCLWGTRHTPMALACQRVGYRQVLTTSSPGKTWNLAGLHCGFVVLQCPALRAKYLAIAEHAYLHFGSAFATAGMMAAYQLGGPWRLRLCRYLESQIEFLESFLQNRVPEMIAIRPQASFLVWMDCSGLRMDAVSGGAASALCLFFTEAARVKLSDGWSFGGEPTAQYQRINVGCSRAMLTDALERIASAVAVVRAGRDADRDGEGGVMGRGATLLPTPTPTDADRAGDGGLPNLMN
jgi:cystathionine beta-lyase